MEPLFRPRSRLVLRPAALMKGRTMTRDQMVQHAAAEFAAGRITEDEYLRLDAVARAAPARRRFWPERVRPKVRDQARRKRLAYSGPMPPALAARFTVSQLAVLAVVAQHADLSVTEIAARAGVSTRTVQTTLRLAEADGLLHIRARSVRPGWNNTNVVTVVSREWRLWIQRGRRGGSGTGVVQSASPLWIQDLNNAPPVNCGTGLARREPAHPATNSSSAGRRWSPRRGRA